MELQVVLRQFDTRDEAELVGELLRASGIEAFVAPDVTESPSSRAPGGAKLFVDVEDFTEAEHLMADAEVDELA